MKLLSLQDKAAYFAKVRKFNYVSSLILAGFSMPPKRVTKPAAGALQSRDTAPKPE